MADYRDGRAMQTGWVRFFNVHVSVISNTSSISTVL